MVSKFSFFESFYEAAKGLADEDRLAFFDAVCAYAFDGEEPGFEGLMSVVWALAKPNIDSSVKGQRSGSEGGRGKKKTTPSDKSDADVKPPSKPPVSKKQNPPFAKSKTNKDMDMDMEREMDMDMEMEAEGKKLLETFSPSAASSAAPAAGAASLSASPDCPSCGFSMFRNTQTGRWTCPNGCSAFKAVAS